MNTKKNHETVKHETIKKGPTLSVGRPIRLEGTGNKAAILIHGYNGLASEMRYLGEMLQGEGYTVAIPRLPGHGTTRKDFFATSWRDWLRRAKDEYLDLAGEFEDVLIIGFSMGGLIATLLAEEFDAKKLVLLAPAFKVFSPVLPFTPVLKRFIKAVPREFHRSATDPERLFLEKEYWSHYMMGPLSQLLKLQKMARRKLKKITARTLLMVSEKDATVPRDTEEYVARKIGTKDLTTLVLMESNHILPDNVERELVALKVKHWLKEAEV